MKRLLLLLFLFAIPAFAQEGVGAGVQYVNSAPVGRCSYQPPIQIVMLTGAIYSCANGNWVQNPGQLAVTSINGVAGPFLFTGGGVSCTATTCVFATPPPLGVTSINSTTGAFTFTGAGVNCTGTSCIFSGGGGSSGVTSINAVAGTFVFNGDAVSCSGTTCTFTQGAGSPGVTSINSNTGAFTFSGSGVACTGTSCVFSTGSGGITPAVPQQLPIYAAGGATIKGAPSLYAIDPSWNQSQINSLFSGLVGGNTVFIPAGSPEIAYTVNNQVPHSFRLRDDWFQMPGIACDGRQSALTILLTSGNSTSNVGSLLSSADIGKTFFFYNKSGYALGSTQSVWTAKLTGYTFPIATWSASAPFTSNTQVFYGTDNLTQVNAAMTQATSTFPMSIPTGCLILVNGTIPWNNNQVIVGRHLNAGGFVGRPGADVIATTDTNGQSVSSAGTGIKGVKIINGTEVDWTLGYNLYASDGTLTVVPPVYRPLYEYPSQQSEDPLAPGWLTGGKNGVASITQNSAVICTPNAMSPPAVGQQIMFPYFTSIFTSTVSSTAGSCSAGFTARTLGAAFPNTSAYTSAQAEWFTGSAIQSTTTTIPTTITYPLNLTTTLSVNPVPGWPANFPQTGHIKLCGVEFDYGGAGGTTITLRNGPTTSVGCTGTTPMAPMNPCAAKNLFGSNADQPWPVTPTVNPGDSTPSGANYFPGQCGGNFAIAFPTANANTYVGAGLVGGFLDDINFQGSAGITSPGISSQNANNAGAVYIAGNNASFGSHFDNLVSQNLQYGIVQGPASSGQHGVAAVGPTGFGNTYHNLWLFAGFPLAFVDLQGSDVTEMNMNATEISPFTGDTIGSSTCLQVGYTLDEQTGGVVTSTSFDHFDTYGCEPENGTHAWVKFAADIQGSYISIKNANFEGIPNLFGGQHLKCTNCLLSLPAVDYGTANDFGTLSGSNAGYITNIWDVSHPAFIEWGANATCSASAGGQGPSVACGAATVQGYQGRGIEPSMTASKPYFALGGMITPWMWNSNGTLDTNAFTQTGSPDTTAKYWGASSQCALGGGALCNSEHFNGFAGFLYMGPFNQLYDGPYLLDATFKSVSAPSSFTLAIAAVDSGSGQCASPATLYSGTVNTTTSYSPFTAGGSVIDMTGHAGCVLKVTYSAGGTTDTILTDRFNLVPQARNLPSVTPVRFGAYGDAISTPGGCSISSSSANLSCGGTAFVSSDVGKQIWVPGAGAAGVALHSSIATVSSSTAVVLAATASTASSGVVAVYGHDDAAAMQACWNYSAANAIQCVLNSPTGYLIGSAGLTMAVNAPSYNGAMNVQGSSQTKGTNLFCEVNGDCVSLQAGPVQGATMANIAIEGDPTQPNGRGIHLNATPAPGSSSNPGGLFNGTFDHIQIDNFAMEGMWFDGGGGAAYAFNLPNQYINLYNLTVNGPNQSHPTNLVKFTGQDAQINIVGGAVNGQDPITNYPNPLIAVQEKTGGMNDAPEAIWMSGWTCEVGSLCLHISQATNIHYDNGYMERVGTALDVINTSGFTFNGNHLANAGFTTAVATLAQNTTGSFRDNVIFGSGGFTPVAMAVCTNTNAAVDFAENTSTPTTTTGCATVQQTPAATFNVVGTTAFVNTSGTTITTINAPNVMPGKTLTLFAAGSFVIGNGGNINMGALTSPYTVATGHVITLTLFDLGPVWVVTAVN